MDDPQAHEGREGTRNSLDTTQNCDHDEMICVRCFSKIHKLEDKITASSIRIGNLEDAKNGNIDSAVMVKDRIYRGRNDVATELDGWFTNLDKQIDAGLFLVLMRKKLYKV